MEKTPHYNEAFLQAYGNPTLNELKELLNVNKLMNHHFQKETKYNIRDNDLAFFHSFLTVLSLLDITQLIKIINSSLHYAKQLSAVKDDDLVLSKQLIIAFSFSFHRLSKKDDSVLLLIKTFDTILGLSRKMRSSDLISNESFIFLFKMVYAFSLHEHNTTKQLRYHKLIYSIIHQLVLLLKKEGLDDNESEDLIVPIIDFLAVKIKENHNLPHLLGSSERMLEALRLVQYSEFKFIPKQKIIGFIADIYSGNYNEMFFKTFSLMVKGGLRNYKRLKETKEDINLFIGQMDLVKEMIDAERKTTKDDPYFCNNGFMLNNNPKSGFSIEQYQLKGKNKPCSIVFAFTPSELLAEIEYPLVAFSSLESKDDFLRILIKSNELILASKSVYRGAFAFKANRMFSIIIDWKLKSVFTTAVSLTVLINNETVLAKDKKKEELDLKISENFKVVFGPPPLNAKEKYFIGKIHPLFLFKKQLEDHCVKSLFNLAGTYWQVLNNCIDLDMSYYNKYAPITTDQIKKSKEYDDLVKFVKENALLVVSPFSIAPQMMKASKLKFHEVVYDFKNNFKGKASVYEFNAFPSVDNCATYPFQYNLTMNQFLRYDGMSIIALHIEYYYNIMHDKISKDLQIEIMKGVSSAIKIIVLYLELSQIIFEELKEEYSTILFSLFKVISFLTDSNINLIQEIGDNLIRLFNSILSLNKKSDYPQVLRELSCKMFIFLLQPRIFTLSDNTQLKKLFHSLNLFLEDYSESDNLITVSTLRLMLEHHILLSGPFLHENYFIPNKITIHQIALSSYKEYKNMRREYESLFGTFISKGDINILNKVLCFILDSPAFVIRYKLLKIYFCSRNKNLKEIKEKKENKLTKKYNHLFNSYSSSDNFQKSDNPEEEKYKELIKSILLQLLLEFKEKKKDKNKNKDKDKDKQLNEDIKNIKNSIIQSSTSLIKEKSNSSFNSQTNKSSNSSNNTSTLPDLKSAPLITIKNIVINGSISFFEVKSIFLLNYDSWDSKAILFFITEKKPLQGTDYLKFYATYNLCLDTFNKQKKSHFLFFIQLLYRIQAQEDSTPESTMLLFCNYIGQVYKAYAQSKAFIQPQIQCQFIHLFESRSIMCSFFTICFQSFEGSKYAKAVLLVITADLVWKHPNPFIFKFAYSHMKSNAGEMVFLMKHIAETFIEKVNTEEQLVSIDKSLNILRFIIVSHKLICSNRITKDVFECDDLSELLLQLILAFKEKTLYFYSNLLLPISKKNKVNKTLYQIFHEIVFQIFEITEKERKIDYVKNLTWLDDFSLFYYLDTRKKKSGIKSKNNKKNYSDSLFQLCETELKAKFQAKDSETRLAVLEFYINFVRFISKMHLIGINLNYDALLILLRSEIISVFALLGNDSFEKEENTLYNQALRQVQFFYANKKQKIGPCITVNDIFITIDTSINQLVEIEYNEKKEKMDKLEKSELSEPNPKEIALIKIIERKDSFTACENKCIESRVKKLSKNLLNDLIAKDNSIASFSFNDLNLDNPILCMKRDLLLKQFGLYFDDIYFYSANFEQLKKQYKALHNQNDPLNAYYHQDERQTMKFPSKTKNYSSCKHFYPRMFLKQDLNFFRKSNHFFDICFKDYSRKDFSYKTFRIKHGLLSNYNNNLFNRDKENYNLTNYFGIFPCERISNETVCFGYLYITKYYLLYECDPGFKATEEYMMNKNYLFSSHVFDIEQRPKQIIIQLNKINELLFKRFLFYPQAIEVFLFNGKSYFFNFFSIKKQLEFIKAIETANDSIPIIRNPKDEFFTGKNYQQQWKNGKITTFDYLLLINKYAGRSYNDVNQYPIMPWVFTQLKDKPEKRNMKLPISVQYENEQKRAHERYLNPISKKYPSHFGIYFSNSAFVNTFLVRLLPFTYNQIKFQNNKFDFPDRQFTSFDVMVYSLINHLDNRELIPEVLSMAEFAYNLNHIEFGKKASDGVLINNLQCPDELSTPLAIISLMKSTLNSQTVRGSINFWIDIVFGFNQKKIQKGCYIYPKQTYEQYVVPKFDAIQKLSDSNQKEMLDYVRKKISSIIPIGQFPMQLFDNLHIQIKHKTVGDNQNNEDFIESVNKMINSTIMPPLEKNLSNKPILYINKAENSNLLYCLTKNLSKKCIAILDMDLNTKNLYPLDRMALMDKSESHRIYHPKYSLVEISNCDIFATCRYYDNTIKVSIVSKKINYSILTESFVNCIKNIDTNALYSGHKNGRLIQWDIHMEEGQFKALAYNRSIIAHQGGVIAIEINLRHEIVLTAGEDNKIFIRKMYDFELLSLFNLNEALIGVDIQMSTLLDLVYVKVYDSFEKKFHVRVYSINGLLFEETEPQLWLSFYITTEKNINLYLDSNKMLSSLSIDLKHEKDLLQLKNASSFYYSEKNKMLFASYVNADFSRTILDIGK